MGYCPPRADGTSLVIPSRLKAAVILTLFPVQGYVVQDGGMIDIAVYLENSTLFG
jgi:hypothetical protein